MKKLHVGVLALFAVFAFGAVLVASAAAETTLPANWLVDGGAIGGTLATEQTGSLLLEDTKTIAGAASVLCTGLVIGSVGPNGEDETAQILNAAGQATGELGNPSLVGNSSTGPDCVTEKLCATGSTTSPIEVWPIGLPWLTTLFLMENGEILDLIFSPSVAKLIGYELLCLVIGITTEDSCTSEDFEIAVVNDVNGDAEIPVGAEASPRALCTQSGEETGVNIADELALINLVNGKLLSVSSE
jgi:hypothetical protein